MNNPPYIIELRNTLKMFQECLWDNIIDLYILEMSSRIYLWDVHKLCEKMRIGWITKKPKALAIITKQGSDTGALQTERMKRLTED